MLSHSYGAKHIVPCKKCKLKSKMIISRGLISINKLDGGNFFFSKQYKDLITLKKNSVREFFFKKIQINKII
jgi:ribosomal protein S4E